MILEKQKEALIHQDGESTESIGMSLDLDSAQVLMQMLSKNLYSDAIGSTIRECASNALDSHRRSGTDKPIVVSLRATKDNTYEFSVEDFGTGLDADDVKNIISKYGKSTKRDSTTELGMMGLGFKAPLAYTSSFYFIARKDGMERKYMMYEGEEVNTIDLLYEAPTDQPNGVKVIVPVSWRNKYEFNKKINEQLAYFENVYFDVEGIDNDFTIVRHEYFQFSELAEDNNLHICLDNVYYPIDFKKLGIDSITLPVGLRFSLTDGIFPTPNRESIRYTQEAKTIILKRLSQAANYFVEKYNESIKETDDVRRIVEYFNSDNRFLVFNSNKWDVHPLSKYSTFKLAEPKFKGAVLLEPSRIAKLQDYILGEYEAKFIVNRKVIRDAKGYSSLTSLRNLKDRKIYVYESDKLSQLKKDYIKSLQAGVFEDSYVFKKVKSFKLRGKLGEYNNYHNILKLRDHPKDQWRQLIKDFQLVVKSLVDTFISLDTIDIPQTFIDSRKKVKVSATGAPGVRRIKLKGEIVCKQAQHLERWVNDKSCKWVSEIYDLSTFHKNKFVLVYARQEDAMLLDQWFKPSRGHNIELATFSDRELKIVDGLKLHNLMPFNKFMEGKNKMFQRIASSCMIDQLRDEYRAVFSNRQHLQNVSTDLYNKVEILENYYKKHFRDIMSDAARDAIAAHATEVNQFDPEIHDTYKQVKTICERLSFLHPILDSMSSYTSRNTQKITEAIVDLFKYHKHKVDLKHYQIKLNDEVELETPITEEVLNDIL